MVFYEDNQITVSCLDANCDGEMEATFSDEEGETACYTMCPECEHKYNIIRSNWSDTPDREFNLKVYA